MGIAIGIRSQRRRSAFGGFTICVAARGGAVTISLIAQHQGLQSLDKPRLGAFQAQLIEK